MTAIPPNNQDDLPFIILVSFLAGGLIGLAMFAITG